MGMAPYASALRRTRAKPRPLARPDVDLVLESLAERPLAGVLDALSAAPVRA